MATTHSTIAATAKSRKKSTRVGRGNASGKGTFCTRGCNGQNARSGGGAHYLFEGGQTPLHRRLPKLKGFTSRNVKPAVMNLDDLEKFAAAGTTEITKEFLVTQGVINSVDQKVKLLGFGKVKSAVNVYADAVSASAEKAVKKAEGTVVISK